MAAEYEKPRAEDEAEEPNGRQSHSGKNGGLETEVIYFKDPTGRRFTFPFSIGKTWHGMEDLIEQATNQIDVFGPFIKDGHFDLISLDGSLVLPSVWEQCIKPGSSFTMRMWKDAENAKKEREAASKKLQAEEEYKRSVGKDKAPIRFKDAVGRKFAIPFDLCRTWQGVEEFIKQAFVHVDLIGPHVQAGHYDLIGPGGEIILPMAWEKTIEPGWAVTMHMWPMERPPQPPPEPPRMFGARGLPTWTQGRGTKPPPSTWSQGRGGQPPVPPRPPTWGEPPAVQAPRIDEFPQKINAPSTTSKTNVGVLSSFLTGRPKREKKKGGAQPIISQSVPQPIVQPLKGQVKTRGVPSVPNTKKSSTSASSTASKESTTGDDTDLSGLDSNQVLETRQEAHNRHLIVVCKTRNPLNTRLRTIRRQNTVPLEIPKLLDIRSARVYWEGSGTLHSASVELIRRQVPPPPQGVAINKNGIGQMTWLHITRNFMNFQEFEDIAQFELSKEPPICNLIHHLFDTIKSRKIDEDWYIKPGTILRCDTEPSEGTFESVLFISIPSLYQSSHDDGSHKGEGYCRDRKLFEAFDQIKTQSDEEKGWYSRRDRDSDRSQQLWVGQTWILLAGTSILTYSNRSRDILDDGSITVQDEVTHAEHGDQIIQIMDKDRRLFYLPSSKCKSFYELQVCMIQELARIEKDKVEHCLVRFHLQDGQELTPGKWIALMKRGYVPLIKASLEVYLSPGSVDERSSSSYRSSSTTRSARRTSRDNSISLDESKIDGNDSDGAEPQATRDDNSGFLLLNSEPETTRSKLDLPKLNRKVPPFFSWVNETESGRAKNIARGFNEAIARIELKLLHIEGRPYPDALMEELYGAYNETKFYEDTMAIDFEEFKLLRESLRKGKAPQSALLGPSLSDDDVKQLAFEYFDVSLLTLESFISMDFKSRLTSKFFGALTTVMKDPTLSLRLGNSNLDAPDPEFSDIPHQEGMSRWIISHRNMMDDQLHHRVRFAGEAKCKACEKGIVYTSLESATAHFRQMHMVSSMTEESLHYYILPLESALEERLVEEQLDVLRIGRDGMIAMLQKLISIQDGVVYDDEFRGQRGLPYQLLEAFRWIFVFVCMVSLVLHEISWFYKDELVQKASKDLTNPKIHTQKQMLSRVRSTTENLIRNAERALISPASFVQDDGPENFLISVGPHYVITRIVCNLLRAPVHKHKRAVDLYETLTKHLWSQIQRYPNKRQVFSIGALGDELGLIRDFHDWQKDALLSFSLVVNPMTYPRGFKHEERYKLFSYERQLIDWEDNKLDKELQHVEQLLSNCQRMIQEVKYRTEIMQDDQGRAIFIFTAVTITFLPLSFVASYVSMSGGTTGLDWDGLQRLFWETAGPLTLVILIFCLGISQREKVMGTIRASTWFGKVMSWRDAAMWTGKNGDRRIWNWKRGSRRNGDDLELSNEK